ACHTRGEQQGAVVVVGQGVVDDAESEQPNTYRCQKPDDNAEGDQATLAARDTPQPRQRNSPTTRFLPDLRGSCPSHGHHRGCSWGLGTRSATGCYRVGDGAESPVRLVQTRLDGATTFVPYTAMTLKQ